MRQFSPEQQREIRATVAELLEQLEATRPARRSRPPKSAEPQPAPSGQPWLPDGQLLANESDVIRALQISESKLDDLVAAGVLEPAESAACCDSARVTVRRVSKP